MARSARTLLCTSLFLLAAGACGSDDNGDDPENQDGSADGAEDGSDGGSGDGSSDGSEDGSDGSEDGSDGSEDGSDGSDGDLAASCAAFCTAQAECLQLTDAQCMNECMAQEQLLTGLDCAAEGAAENECMATLTCEELQAYATEGKRTNEKCGAVATDYFAACTVGESAECTAMCARYEECDALPISVAACEESCLLRIANLTVSVDEGCADAFVDVATCISTVSCEELTATTGSGAPESCAEADQAQLEACGG